MKLNIEELAREAELSAVAATPQPVKVGDGDKFLKLRDEFFARLIVERCAVVCESKYQSRSDGGFPREASTARALRDEIRNLLEAE